MPKTVKSLKELCVEPLYQYIISILDTIFSIGKKKEVEPSSKRKVVVTSTTLILIHTILDMALKSLLKRNGLTIL